MSIYGTGSLIHVPGVEYEQMIVAKMIGRTQLPQPLTEVRHDCGAATDIHGTIPSHQPCISREQRSQGFDIALIHSAGVPRDQSAQFEVILYASNSCGQGFEFSHVMSITQGARGSNAGAARIYA